MFTGQWYYRLDGRSHGPFTPVQFEKLIRGKTVTPSTDVSQDGKTWQSLRDLLAGESADPPTAVHSDFMEQQTLLPGECILPPGWRSEQKKTD
jgi:hypothetical protein